MKPSTKLLLLQGRLKVISNFSPKNCTMNYGRGYRFYWCSIGLTCVLVAFLAMNKITWLHINEAAFPGFCSGNISLSTLHFVQVLSFRRITQCCQIEKSLLSSYCVKSVSILILQETAQRAQDCVLYIELPPSQLDPCVSPTCTSFTLSSGWNSGPALVIAKLLEIWIFPFLSPLSHYLASFTANH